MIKEQGRDGQTSESYLRGELQDPGISYPTSCCGRNLAEVRRVPSSHRISQIRVIDYVERVSPRLKL